MSAITPSQTVGPFLHIALGPVSMRDGGVRIRGRVLDGAGESLTDALVEVSAPGGCFGRSDTRSGGFEVAAVKPDPRDDQAPHLAVSVFARGLLKRAVTRMYFPDEAEANATDPVLSGVEEDAARRSSRFPIPTARFVSMSISRVPTRLCSSRCDLRRHLRAGGDSRSGVGSRLGRGDARGRELCNAESLAGVVPAHLAGSIAEACRIESFDVAAIIEAGGGVDLPSPWHARCARWSVARRRTTRTTARRARTSWTARRCSSPAGRSG